MEPDSFEALEKQLRLPQPPVDFEAQLKSNFHHQLAQERQQKRRSLYLPALAASLLLSLIFSFYYGWQQPRFIQAAQAHTLHETALHGQFATPDYTTWRTRLDLPEAPSEAQLVLLKDCTVKGEPFKHLRFQYADGNSVDVLVAHSSTAPINGQGGNALKGFWMTAHKDSLWMLALYRDATTAERAQHLIHLWTTTS